MRRFLLLLAFAAVSIAAGAQGTIHGIGDPSTATPRPNCGQSRFYVDDSTGKLYMAAAGSPCVWTDASATGGYPGVTTDGANGIKSSGVTAQKVAFYDNFNYADGLLVGHVAPTGQTWQVSGTQSANAQVIGHAFQYSPRTVSGPLAFYAYADVGANVYSYSATFTVNANPGGSGSPDSSCAFGMSIVHDPTHLLNNMLHMGGSCTAASINWWDGSNHTPAYCSNLTYTSPMTVGHTYTITITWDGANTVTEIGPNGESMMCSDSNFAASGGTGFFAELAYNTTDYAYPTISNITVTTQGGTGLVADSVTAPILKGCLGCSVNGMGLAYVQALGIGTQAPTVPLHEKVSTASGDTAIFEQSGSTYASVRIKSDTGGAKSHLYLDNGESNPPNWYDNGTTLVANANNVDQLSMGASGVTSLTNFTASLPSTLNDPGTGAFQSPARFLCTGINPGGECTNYLTGTAASSNNMFRATFHYAGAGSTSNYIYLDLGAGTSTYQKCFATGACSFPLPIGLSSQTVVASATTIAPTAQTFHVSGTTAIATITAPTGCTASSTMCQFTLIPDGLWTTTTAGNIAIASTAVVSKTLVMTYDPATTKWYPSY